jgi:hypothetical protein
LLFPKLFGEADLVDLPQTPFEQALERDLKDERREAMVKEVHHLVDFHVHGDPEYEKQEQKTYGVICDRRVHPF